MTKESLSAVLIQAVSRRTADTDDPVDQARPDSTATIRRLNEALTTEMICVLRYKRHSFIAQTVHADRLAAHFSRHAAEEQRHADLLSQRIVELGAEPELSPSDMADRSHEHCMGAGSLTELIEEELIAERGVIEDYRGFLRDLGDRDSATRTLLETILASEEAQAADLAQLLDR